MLKSWASRSLNGSTLSVARGHKTATIVCVPCLCLCSSFHEPSTNILHHLVWERPDFHSSPSIARSIDAALQVSRLQKEDIDLFDFYSYVSSLHCPPQFHVSDSRVIQVFPHRPQNGGITPQASDHRLRQTHYHPWRTHQLRWRRQQLLYARTYQGYLSPNPILLRTKSLTRLANCRP
jgi:hypothetical protein